MRTKFYLKRPDSKQPTSVFALVSYNGSSIKIYTAESIHPKYWNPKSNAAKNTPGFPEHPEFNERLNQIRSTINRTFLDYKNQNDHTAPSLENLKPLIAKALKKETKKQTFLAYYQEFLQKTSTGQRLNHRNKQNIREGAAKGYQTTYNHLLAFSKKWKRNLDFDTVDMDFHNEFTKYLSAAPLVLSRNTIGSHFQRIKAVLSDATERGINSNMTFKSKHFIKQTEDAETIYLSEDELREMRDLNLENNDRLANVRDLFLIGCYTGLRFSDFSVLKPKNIEDGFIKITQIKTGAPVVIPVHPVVADIIKKNNGGLPRAISNVKLNAYLKELGQLMPSLKQSESRSITKGGTKQIRNVKKWELLTSHTARRSFATNQFLLGMRSITIMAITGHKTEKSFLKYIRVTPQEHAEKMKEMWEKKTENIA